MKKFSEIYNEIISKEEYKSIRHKNNKSKIDRPSYKENLRIILKRFFTEPGDRLPKRTLVIPLRSKKARGLAGIDKEIIRYLNNHNFSCTPESYELGLCTNSKGAQISILNTLKEIKQYDIVKIKASIEKVKNNKQALDNLNSKIKLREDLKENYVSYYNNIDKQNDMVIAFTWVPRKIASQSTSVGWKSCMNLFAGSNSQYVWTGIEQGQFIAWLVKKGDENKLDKPQARVLIKVFESFRGGDKIWWPAKIVYGTAPDTFKIAVQKFLYSKQKKYIKSSFNELANSGDLETDLDLSGYDDQYYDQDNVSIKDMAPKEFKKYVKGEIKDLHPRDITDELLKKMANSGLNKELIEVLNYVNDNLLAPILNHLISYVIIKDKLESLKAILKIPKLKKIIFGPGEDRIVIWWLSDATDYKSNNIFNYVSDNFKIKDINLIDKFVNRCVIDGRYDKAKIICEKYNILPDSHKMEYIFYDTSVRNIPAAKDLLNFIIDSKQLNKDYSQSAVSKFIRKIVEDTESFPGAAKEKEVVINRMIDSSAFSKMILNSKVLVPIIFKFAVRYKLKKLAMRLINEENNTASKELKNKAKNLK